jgi:hypothetical protein
MRSVFNFFYAYAIVGLILTRMHSNHYKQRQLFAGQITRTQEIENEPKAEHHFLHYNEAIHHLCFASTLLLAIPNPRK